MQMSIKIWDKLFDLIREIQLQIYKKTNSNRQLDIIRVQNILDYFIACTNLTEPNIEYDFNLHMRKLKQIQDDLKRFLKHV